MKCLWCTADGPPEDLDDLGWCGGCRYDLALACRKIPRLPASLTVLRNNGLLREAGLLIGARIATMWGDYLVWVSDDLLRELDKIMRQMRGAT